MLFYWPKLPYPYYSRLLISLSLYRLVLWGWGPLTDRVYITLPQPCTPDLFLIIIKYSQPISASCSQPMPLTANQRIIVNQCPLQPISASQSANQRTIVSQCPTNQRIVRAWNRCIILPFVGPHSFKIFMEDSQLLLISRSDANSCNLAYQLTLKLSIYLLSQNLHFTINSFCIIHQVTNNFELLSLLRTLSH